MSTTILWNGTTYSIPAVGDEDWGQSLTSFFIALPQGALQKTGGTFTLTADVNFGATYGLKSAYYSSRTANPSSAGTLRLAISDSIGFRNNANSGNLLLAVNGSDNLTFNGSALTFGGITALTGDVTATGPGSVAATIAANTVTLAKMATMATASFLGRNTAGTGNPEVLSATTATAILSAMVGDSGSGGTKGLVPVPAAGTAAAGKFLKADGTWAVPSGTTSGTVTSVAMTVPTFLSIGGSPITSSGTLAITLSGTALPVLNGGTGVTTSTGSGANALATSPTLVTPILGTPTSGTLTSCTGLPLTTGVTGILPIANGGTNVSAVTTAPTASAFAGWDANSNLSAKNHIAGFRTQATANSTLALVVGDAAQQYFTGTTAGQIVTLPTTGVVAGQSYQIVNSSNQTIAVQSSGANAILTVAAANTGVFTALVATPTTAANWSFTYATSNNSTPPVGTVTSVAASGPSGIATWSSAVTASGTLTQTLSNQTANTLLSGPASGSAATPAFRALVDADMPTGGLNPSGQITLFGGSSAPSGWLLCDGSAVSRTTYAALFTAISTTFGTGDGTTTFNVPDMRGVFPKGAGTTSRTAGKDASGNFYAGTLGTYSTDQLQGHFHSNNFRGEAGGGAFNAPAPLGTGGQTDAITGPISDGTNGTPRTGHTTEPQSLGLTYIIKT